MSKVVENLGNGMVATILDYSEIDKRNGKAYKYVITKNGKPYKGFGSNDFLVKEEIMARIAKNKN